MAGKDTRELLLGKQTPVVDVYSPGLLYPIARSEARNTLGLQQPLPFFGSDIWHAYEMSWLDASGRPVARVGRFDVDVATPNIVESKSFKLYLNSLNNSVFASEAEAVARIQADIADTAGGKVQLRLYQVDDPALAGMSLVGDCIDSCDASVPAGEPEPEMLELEGTAGNFRLYSHLLRSLCPVTGQPDWASLWLHYRGPGVRRASLLRYVLAYRQHQEFHEQCVERIFRDLQCALKPDFLHVQALYTRRGGLDINPFRSTDPGASPLPRLNRQ